MKTIIKFKRKRLLDYLILALIFCEILKYKPPLVNAVLLVLILIKMLFATYRKRSARIILLLNVAYIIFALYIARKVSFHSDIFWKNTRALLYSLNTAAYFYFIFTEQEQWATELINKVKPAINIFFYINFITSWGQILYYRLIVNINYVEAWDASSGILSSVTSYAYLFIFYLTYNLSSLEKKQKGQSNKQKLRLLIITFAVLIESALNDNKGLYILLIYYLAIYWLHRRKRGVELRGLIIFALIVACYISYQSILLIGIDGPIIRGINNIIETINVDYNPNATYISGGSSERFWEVYYAFQRYNALSYGQGLSAAPFQAERYLMFYHFGQSDLGTFLILGGLFFTLVTITIFMYYYTKLSKARGIQIIEILVALLLGMVFTQVISMNSMQIIFISSLLSFRLFIYESRTKGMIIDETKNNI